MPQTNKILLNLTLTENMLFKQSTEALRKGKWTQFQTFIFKIKRFIESLYL